jgi:hypothetical protein
MKKIYICVFFFSVNLFAQTEFEVITRSEVYEDLDNPISLTNGLVWDDPDLVIPLGFDFELSSNIFNTLYINEEFSSGAEVTLSPSDFNNSPIFAPTTLDYIDRGLELNVSESDISYKLVEGDEGKILKIQWKNVGFYNDETREDFMNVQMWLYENLNKIEYHYGSVQISNADEVYDFLSGTSVAVASSYDLLNDGFLDNAYFLTESPDDPTVETILAGQSLDEPYVLNGTIPENTVYEFRNTTLNISSFIDLDFDLYPNPVSEIINIKTNLSKFETEIYTLLGQVVLLNSNEKEINISHLPNGIYLVRINSNNNTFTKKIIKR